jgi:predicted ribosomally synthesized peptide with SipW-like signal peptide
MNTKIITSLATILVVGAAAVGGTYAWFTSSPVSSNSNTFTSGTLIAGLSDGGSSDAFDLGTVTNFAPGDETNTATIVIKNNGTLNLGWFGYFNLSGVTKDMDKAIYIKDAQMEFLNPTTGTWETTDHFIANGTGSGTYGAYYTTLAASDPMGVISMRTWNNDNAMGAGNGVQIGALKPGYSYKLTVKLAMADAADNTYQGGEMTVNYVVKATQLKAGALNYLGSLDAKIVDTASNLLTWMEAQIVKQI